MTAGSQHACGLRTDNRLICWGANHVGQADAPDGEFTAVTAGSQHACAVTADSGAIVCWGGARSHTSPPNGPFRAVSAGDEHTCGLRTDNSIVCWGVAHVDPPTGVGSPSPGPGQPDPSRCRPYGTSDASAGFPLPPWALRSTGTLRVAVVFVDFPDTVAVHSTRREAELGLPFMKEYVESASYGMLNIEFEPLEGWLRAEHGRAHYMSSGTDALLDDKITDEALRLSDPLLDFSDVAMLMVVMPSSHFHGGTFTARTIETQEGATLTARANFVATPEPRGPTDWGTVAAHEFLHGLGLIDLYLSANRVHVRPGPPAGSAWIQAEFGLMVLRGHFLAREQDPRLAHEWVYPDGYRSTSYRHSLEAIEMLAWSRWQLSWLDEPQVRCVSGGEATIALAAVADPGEGIAMAAVPLSAHEIIVVESRRKIGHDAGQQHIAANGVRTTFSALAAEGVLIYTVDARLAPGHGPIRAAGDSGDGIVDDYPTLQPGQTVNVRGYTIAVLADDGDTHTVRISKVED